MSLCTLIRTSIMPLAVLLRIPEVFRLLFQLTLQQCAIKKNWDYFKTFNCSADEFHAVQKIVRRKKNKQIPFRMRWIFVSSICSLSFNEENKEKCAFEYVGPIKILLQVFCIRHVCVGILATAGRIESNRWTWNVTEGRWVMKYVVTAYTHWSGLWIRFWDDKTAAECRKFHFFFVSILRTNKWSATFSNFSEQK